MQIREAAAPCKGCMDRNPGCHDRCSKYQTYKKANEDHKAKVMAEKEQYYLLHRYNVNKTKPANIRHHQQGR